MNYIKKHLAVTKAAQFDGSSVTNIRELGLEATVSPSGYLKITTPSAIIIVEAGYWVLISGTDVQCITDTEFRDQYKSLPNTEKTESR